jgi:ATPase subunit of ABC transporter with duplicated ATPase domains
MGMPKGGVDFVEVAFNYPGMTEPLIEDLTCRFAPGWTGIVGANGAGKSTILKLAAGLLEPDAGEIRGGGFAIYCEQRTDDVPPLFEDLLRAEDEHAILIKLELGIAPDWAARWMTLSHGERKRAQVGVILWRRPDVLAVDEPTNHLDIEGRALLAMALRRFRGVGLLVSHDRDLLDTLCGHSLFVEPPLCDMRRGGYSKAHEAREREEASLRRRHDLARTVTKKIEREAAKRREAAASSDARRSKKNLEIGDHDGRDKINRARLTGKDAVAGKLLRQIKGRLKQAREREGAARTKKTYETGIWLAGARSKRDFLFSVPTGEVGLGGGRLLTHPDLVMRPDDRIALTGPNGAGKSTLVRAITESLDLPVERVTYIPQEIGLDAAAGILERARNLPKDKLGFMMTIVSRLGSRPHRLLESIEPSPGETRKLLLAMGIANEPHLIVMDEPTNHMDLPSIECLEDALDDCPSGLLLVSHDTHFLRRLTRKRWDISRPDAHAGAGAFRLSEKRWE